MHYHIKSRIFIVPGILSIPVLLIMQQLINYIEKFVPLNDETVQALSSLVEFESYKKNQYIIEPGERCNKLWFLVRGMIRKFHLVDGREVTSWIHVENEMLTSLQSYGQRVPSHEYLHACEDSELISISRTNSEKLIQYPEILAFTNLMMEREFVNIDKNTKALNSLDARGKYEYLWEIAPEMMKRAKLGYIASIIGVTPETLSRIRRH